MIYLQNSKRAQRVVCPSQGRQAEGDVVFKLRNTTDRANILTEVVELESNGQYWVFELPARSFNLPAGECEYRLIDDVGFLSSGVAVVTDDLAVLDREYEQIKTYKQYGSEK